MKLDSIIRVLLVALLGFCLPPEQARAAAASKSFDASSLAAIKAAHAGRPFVLAFWSISCAPCLADMADWRKLRMRYPAVPILLVNTDAVADGQRVRDALARFPPGNVEHWRFSDDFAERVRYSVDPSWRGELPRTYFFDRSHKPELVTGRLDGAWMDSWFDRAK